MWFHEKRRELKSNLRSVGLVPVAVATALWLASLPVIATTGSAPAGAESELAHVFTAPGTVDGGGVEVLVREIDPDTMVAESLVADVGGIVGVQVADLGGFMATIPPSELATLITADSIMSLSIGPRTP